MAQQKSETRVVLEGGVMPAEPARSSRGERGKAGPVDEQALQLCLPIATADVPSGISRTAAGSRSVRAGVPQAIVNAQTGTPVTMMEEVARRLTSAMLKVAS